MYSSEVLMRLLVQPGQVVPNFDANVYRTLHDDLKGMNDGALHRHYSSYGKSEGRIASLCDLREGFLGNVLDDAPVLEIGPFTAAALRKPNVDYFDVMTADELRARAEAHGFPIVEPVRIDFVSSNGSLGIIDKKYEVVFSSHCVEHTPDFVSHLQQVERLLEDGGRYMMIIPDRRYTFDYYRAQTTPSEVMEAYNQRKTLHDASSIESYYLNSTHNDCTRHWQGDHGPHPAQLDDQRMASLKRDLERCESEYVDVHAWFFQSDTFERFLDKVISMAGLGFKIENIYNTVQGRNEFNAVLRKLKR